MPIAGWTCPNPACKSHGPVPLDHFATTECGLVVHPDYAAAILADREDPRYSAGSVSVTDGLTCPRSRALENSDDTPVYPNPLDYNALLIGRAWDNFIVGQKRAQLSGIIAGIPMMGEYDGAGHVNGELILWDWKHSNNNQQRFMKKEMVEGKAVKYEYRIQTSIYAELYRQVHGESPTRGMVWNHYSGAQSSSNSVLIPLLYDFVPLDEALAFKPYGGDYTVLELYQQTAGLYADEPVRWEDLPLVGKTMSFGTKEYCDYCQMRATCFTQSGGAPF